MTEPVMTADIDKLLYVEWVLRIPKRDRTVTDIQLANNLAAAVRGLFPWATRYGDYPRPRSAAVPQPEEPRP